MNRKTISAMAILEHRSFDLERKRRIILNILEFQSHSKNVPKGLLKQLNDALVNADKDLDIVNRILGRVKQ